MNRLLLGLTLGLTLGLLGSPAQGADAPEEELVLTESTMGTFGRTQFKVPETFGRLVNVVVSSDVHYLYFEDPAGTIRIVPVGQRGAAQRARSQLQLLSENVHVIERGGLSRPAETAETPGR
jgi:hypothetical protein